MEEGRKQYIVVYLGNGNYIVMKLNELKLRKSICVNLNKLILCKKGSHKII